MGRQHRGGHGAHAPRHRGDGCHHRLSLRKADIAAEFAVFVGVDAHIHHRLTRGDAVPADGAPFAHGHHQNVRLTADFGEVPGPGIADGDGGVFPVQQHGRRFSHHQAAAHHRHPLALQGDAVEVQNFHAGLRRTGGISHPAAGKDARQRGVGDAVHVLFRGQGGTDRLVVHLGRQGPENQTAVDAGVLVDLLHNRQKLGLGGVGFQQIGLDRDPHLGAAVNDPPLIGQVIFPGPHPHHRQGRDNSSGCQGGSPGGGSFIHGGSCLRAL